MSGPGLQDGRLDARLRRAFAGIDTSPGFEARIAARISGLHAEPADAIRERIEHGQLRTAQRLRREAWVSAASVAGVGAAGLALVWRHGPAIARWTEAALTAASAPSALMGLALGALSLGLWSVLRGSMHR